MYHLKLSQQQSSIKSSWTISCVNWSDIRTLMMGMEMIPEMLVALCNQMRRLTAQENFIDQVSIFFQDMTGG